MGSPADDHRRTAGAFTVTVESTALEAWDNPAPPEGWVARDVVRHLVEWFTAFLQGSTGITLPAGPSVDDDPVGAWRTHTDAVQALLDDPTTAARERDLPHIGTMPLGQAIDMIYTADVFLHRWDLARATGQDETLDPDRCAEMLEGMLRWRTRCAKAATTGHASTSPTTPTPRPGSWRSSAAPHRRQMHGWSSHEGPNGQETRRPRRQRKALPRAWCGLVLAGPPQMTPSRRRDRARPGRDSPRRGHRAGRGRGDRLRLPAAAPPLRDRVAHPAASVHFSTATEIRAQRALVLDRAFAAHHPERFTTPPTPPSLPTLAWINQPSREALIQTA